VISHRKREANRANSRLSTGPRTPSGKARASQNARRQGLSVPVSSDPTFAPEIDDLLRELTRRIQGRKFHELLSRFAEAQIELIRIRGARDRVIAAALGDSSYEPRRALAERAKLALDLKRGSVQFGVDEVIRALYPESLGEFKYASILADFSKRLAAFERYERRALSRRKFAVRALDSAGFEWPAAPDLPKDFA
jgi:hypothetical protein